jgi:hypothetical protein
VPKYWKTFGHTRERALQIGSEEYMFFVFFTQKSRKNIPENLLPLFCSVGGVLMVKSDYKIRVQTEGFSSLTCCHTDL